MLPRGVFVVVVGSSFGIDSSFKTTMYNTSIASITVSSQIHHHFHPVNGSTTLNTRSYVLVLSARNDDLMIITALPTLSTKQHVSEYRDNQDVQSIAHSIPTIYPSFLQNVDPTRNRCSSMRFEDAFPVRNKRSDSKATSDFCLTLLRSSRCQKLK